MDRLLRASLSALLFAFTLLLALGSAPGLAQDAPPAAVDGEGAAPDEDAPPPLELEDEGAEEAAGANEEAAEVDREAEAEVEESAPPPLPRAEAQDVDPTKEPPGFIERSGQAYLGGAAVSAAYGVIFTLGSIITTVGVLTGSAVAATELLLGGCGYGSFCTGILLPGAMGVAATSAGDYFLGRQSTWEYAVMVLVSYLGCGLGSVLYGAAGMLIVGATIFAFATNIVPVENAGSDATFAFLTAAQLVTALPCFVAAPVVPAATYGLLAGLDEPPAEDGASPDDAPDPAAPPEPLVSALFAPASTTDMAF